MTPRSGRWDGRAGSYRERPRPRNYSDKEAVSLYLCSDREGCMHGRCSSRNRVVPSRSVVFLLPLPPLCIGAPDLSLSLLFPFLLFLLPSFLFSLLSSFFSPLSPSSLPSLYDASVLAPAIVRCPRPLSLTVGAQAALSASAHPVIAVCIPANKLQSFTASSNSSSTLTTAKMPGIRTYSLVISTS